MTETTERDWEAAARRRVEKLVADTIARMRQAVDEVEREATRGIQAAAKPDRFLESHTYPRVAGQVAHTVQTLMFNLPLSNLIDATNDAETARTEKNRELTR